MDKKKLLWILMVLICVLVGGFLRLKYINAAFWYDEACTWFAAKQSFPFGILDYLWNKDLQHTPLYFFLVHFWMKLFGNSEVTLRSLSLIFSLLSIPLTFVVCKKLMSKMLAIIISAIITVCPILVVFSVEARMYPVVVFFVLLSLNYLVDFEHKGDNKSLIKLVISNLLIPYTLIGGILYNIAVALCYGMYLFKNNREKFFRYLKAFGFEVLCLIPCIVTVIHYAIERSLFVIRHEGMLSFYHIVDAVRNIFATNVVSNPYWPNVTSYFVDFSFTMLVIVPCVYFIYGIIQGAKNSTGFMKVLYNIVLLVFATFILFSLMQVNVFTVRYFLYLVIPMFILAVYGLSLKICENHIKIFVTYYLICSAIFCISYVKSFTLAKESAFKAVKIEAEELGLGVDDMIIAPFGSDAPYYFRYLSAPRVFDFDLHKEVRNPNNDKFYDKNQQKALKNKKYRPNLIFKDVVANNVFSNAFLTYFVQNVNYAVPSGNFVLIALYDSDSKSLVSIKELQEITPDIGTRPSMALDLLFKKVLVDIRFLLEKEFTFVKSYVKGSYTYLLYQKN